jgi:hypothetical protein
MEAQRNTPARSHRPPRRPTGFVVSLLLAVLAAILTAPTASAAPEVASEVAAAAGSAAAPVTKSAPTATTPPPVEAPAPAPTPQPASVPEPTATVDRSLSSNSSSAASKVVHESARQSTATADAVTGGRSSTHVDAVTGGSSTHIPVVDDATHRGGEVANSLTDDAAEATGTAAAPEDPPHGAGVTDRPTGHRAAGPAGRRGRAGPPPPTASLRFAEETLALSSPVSQREVRPTPTGPGKASGVPAAVDAPLATAAYVSIRSGDAGQTRPAIPWRPPSPVPLAEAAASPVGGGFGFSLLLLGLTAAFTLAAPRSPPRLLAAGARYRPAPFICALDPPG